MSLLLGILRFDASQNRTCLKLFRAAVLPPLAYSLFFFFLPLRTREHLACGRSSVHTGLAFVSCTRSWSNRPIVIGICTMISFAAGAVAGMFHVVVMSLSDRERTPPSAPPRSLRFKCSGKQSNAGVQREVSFFVLHFLSDN